MRWRDLAARTGRVVSVSVSATPGEALDTALRAAEGPILVTGSLHLVGAVRARLVEDPELADPDDT
jgi:folylpolyglutamate synthase/dihydropteroate synthase